MLVQTAVVCVLSCLLLRLETESGLQLCRGPGGVRPGQGKIQGLEMIALTTAAVLTSPLLTLVEEFHSFCEKVPPSVVQEWV